ncbi:MAG: hypothetical protein KAW52_03965 [candidate division Zixibacteria bacterium]|nr:hypothetical protein [candidate division Zixibacteria bacterium]
MKSKILFSSLVIILLAINLNCAQENMINLLPAGTDGWVTTGQPEVYDRNNLFDYMDGGAELYLAYDFQALVMQRYLSDSKYPVKKNSITIEIYQMNSSPDAYGLFSFDQVGEMVEIGQKGVYGYGLLKFWKDKFFVRILGSQADLKETIFKFGADIDKKMKTEGKPPDILSKIPKDNLIPNSDHFFHKQILLNNLYFLSDKNILDLSDKTDCLLADFKFDKQILKLFLIEYADSKKAQNAYEKFNEFYLKNEASKKNKIVEIEKGKLVGMDLEKNYLILVFEGTDKERIIQLLNTVGNSLVG